MNDNRWTPHIGKKKTLSVYVENQFSREYCVSVIGAEGDSATFEISSRDFDVNNVQIVDSMRWHGEWTMNADKKLKEVLRKADRSFFCRYLDVSWRF
jgi:hypothetical protein